MYICIRKRKEDWVHNQTWLERSNLHQTYLCQANCIFKSTRPSPPLFYCLPTKSPFFSQPKSITCTIDRIADPPAGHLIHLLVHFSRAKKKEKHTAQEAPTSSSKTWKKKLHGAALLESRHAHTLSLFIIPHRAMPYSWYLKWPDELPRTDRAVSVPYTTQLYPCFATASTKTSSTISSISIERGNDSKK